MSASPFLATVSLRVRTAEDVVALFAGMAGAATERCAFAYLDPEWMLLGTRETAPGNVHGAGVSLREVIADALRTEASAVVMAHNHPGGDASPSAADIALTRRLIAGLEAIDVRLVDHVVIARGAHASMRALGLL